MVNQRRTLSVLDCTDGRGGRYAAGGELSGGVLIRPGMLEHSTNGTNSKHEESSLVRIEWAYKICSLHLFLKTLLLVHTG